MANTIKSKLSKNTVISEGSGEIVEFEPDELWLINRYETHNKMQLRNTRDNLKKLLLEEKLIREIKKKWKS